MKKPRKQFHNLHEFPAYKKWVLARDRALEELHHTAQAKATDEMRAALTNILMAARSAYSEIKDPHKPQAIDYFDRQVKDILRHAGLSLELIYRKLKARSYALAKGSESEILARLNKKDRPKATLTHPQLDKLQQRDSVGGGPIGQRIQMYMDRLGRKIVGMAHSSALNAKDKEAFLIDVLQAFPQKKSVKVPRRILKPKLMEADGQKPAAPNISISTGDPDWLQTYQDARRQGATSAEATMLLDQVGQATWNEMLDDYKSEFVPKWRAPEYVVDIPITDPTIQRDGTEVWYAWEFERDMTNEFVAAVRDGQIDSAKENGITDFVWIAVIDSVTDACCRWRDGLLVSEIEAQLDNHTDDDEECRLDGDGLVPPIHFNCRCTLAPATENIPDKPDDGSSSFEEWLES